MSPVGPNSVIIPVRLWGADPLVVTQNGVARLVVMDAADHECREQTLALLKLLALGDREIERGEHLDAVE